MAVKYRVVRNERLPDGTRLIEYADGITYLQIPQAPPATPYRLAEIKLARTSTLQGWLLIAALWVALLVIFPW